MAFRKPAGSRRRNTVLRRPGETQPQLWLSESPPSSYPSFLLSFFLSPLSPFIFFCPFSSVPLFYILSSILPSSHLSPVLHHPLLPLFVSPPISHFPSCTTIFISSPPSLYTASPNSLFFSPHTFPLSVIFTLLPLDPFLSPSPKYMLFLSPYSFPLSFPLPTLPSSPPSFLFFCVAGSSPELGKSKHSLTSAARTCST